MTSVIDRNLIQQVVALSQNGSGLDRLVSDIQSRNNAQEIILALIQELNLAHQNRSQLLPIKYTQSITTLYNRLDSLVTAQVVDVARTCLFGQKRGEPLAGASHLVSELIANSTNELTLEAFQTIKALHPEIDSLSLTLRGPVVVEELTLAQQALGPIKSLTIDFPYTEETLLEILDCCPHLTELNVERIKTFTDTVLVKVPQAVTILYASATAISDEGLAAFLAKDNNLSVLHVAECSLSYQSLMTLNYPITLVDFCCSSCWEEKVEVEKNSGWIFRRTQETEIVAVNSMQVIREKLQQESPASLTLAAVALLESEEAEKGQALEWLEKAIELNGQFIPAVVAYAELLRQGAYGVKANPKPGLQLIDRMLNDFPEHPHLLACKALYLLDAKNDKEARKWAQDAYCEAPWDQFVLATYAEILRRNGKHPLATLLCARALSQNSSNSLAITCKASLSETPDPLKAYVLFRQAIRINPYNEAALVGLANMLFVEEIVQGDHKEAISLLQTALQANPDSSRAHFTLAQIYIKLGDLENARRHFEAAYKADPKDATIVSQYAEFIKEGSPDKYEALTEELKALQDMELQPQQKRSRNVRFSDVVVVDELMTLEDDCAKSPEDMALLTRLGVKLLTIDEARATMCLKTVIKKKEACFVEATVALANHLIVGNPERATELLEEVDAEAATVDVHLALARCTQNDASIEKVLELDPNNIQAKLLKVRSLLSNVEEESSGEDEPIDVMQDDVTPDVTPMEVVHDSRKEANDLLTSIITTGNLDAKTRTDIVVLLAEFPELLGDGRQKALSLLQKM
ncbi:MAG: tetratricopeptide repeat protein [Verrucomicrobia bacterium]|nr:tetratricopeptide repeat protein [Verrucomicrobiota bacterium]MBS0637493.1 tetratricopeptide repeat protein [Verrucomicrobiota bacterium]